MRRALLLSGLLLVGCSRPQDPDADANGSTAPTEATLAANRAVGESLPFSDTRDFDDARRGLIATPENLKITRANGDVVWDMNAYDFVTGDAPGSVNPSLWRQAKLNGIHGLFKVADGIYQVRGYDVSNITLIEGKTGWIVVDPLTTLETASAAMALVKEHLGDRPVRAFIFTHSHVDHFGGVLGVVSAEQARKPGLRVVVPSGFLEEATSENVLSAPTMLRRAYYMYGQGLPRGPRQYVDTGLGKNPAQGTLSILPPTDVIERTGQRLTLDGVEFEFLNAPASEAPSEMAFWLPQKKAVCGAEVVSRTLHNLYTLRGAKVRDALRWSGYIEDLRTRYPDAEVYFGSHQWPLWGRERIDELMRKQRDVYKYIHDQTLHQAWQGATPGEIAESIRLPKSLDRYFSTRGYYGTVRHNARAVYQHYFGWYDANPAHLDPLPPEDAAKKYVAAMGGEARVLEQARKAYADGDYRWTAELLDRLVFAGGGTEARELLAQTYDQLGYQAESGPWRSVYLSAAGELRHGIRKDKSKLGDGIEMLRRTSVTRFLDAMAVGLNGPKADGVELTVNLRISDLGEGHVLEIENAVLHHRPGQDAAAAATLDITHEKFLRMMLGEFGLKDLLFSDAVRISGSKAQLLRFFSLFEPAIPNFPIVTP